MVAACGSDDNGDAAPDPTAASTDGDSGTSDTTDETANGDGGTSDTAPGSDDSEPPPADLVTGRGVTEDTIRLAALSDLSGPVASAGRPIALGFETYFDALNAQGGIAGRQVEVVPGDTRYDGQVAVQVYNQIASDVLAIQVFGTPIVGAIRALAAEDSMVVIPGSKDSDFLRDQNIVLVTTPVSLEVANAVDYIVNELHGGTPPAIGIIYQADDLGADHRHGLSVAAETYGFEVVAESSMGAADTSADGQVQAMRNAGAEYVIMGVGPGAANVVIGAAAASGYEATFVGGGSSFTGALLQTATADAWKEQFITTCSTAVWTADIEGMQNLEAARAEYAPEQPPDNSFQYGYLQALVLHGIIDQAISNGDLTPEGLVEATTQIVDLDTQGFTTPITIGSEPEERIPYRSSQMCAVDDSPGNFTPITSFFEGEAAAVVGLRD
jgi:ABC-type branched-subunit amino acid transport system substrate-binding protein